MTMCLIQSCFGTGRSTKETTTVIAYSPKDWKETPEEHEIKVVLLGLKNVGVTLDGKARVLQISAERSKEEEERNHSSHHRMERSSSGRRFLSRYMVPENANVNHVKFLTENEVLTVTFKKEEIKKPILTTGLDK